MTVEHVRSIPILAPDWPVDADPRVPAVFAAAGETTSPRWARAFAQGCRGPVIDVPGGSAPEPEAERRPFAAFMSPVLWTLYQRARAEGRTFYYGDHAYFGRHRFYRVTRDRAQHDGIGAARPDRFRALGLPVSPWRRQGRSVLICPNSAAFFALHGLDRDNWVRQVRARLRIHTDRPLCLHNKHDPEPIERALRGVWAVVVFTSNAAVDALRAGVPVFLHGPEAVIREAAAYRMGSNDLSRIEAPAYPDDREPFFWNLSANQWTFDEMRAGDAWRALRDAAGREAP